MKPLTIAITAFVMLTVPVSQIQADTDPRLEAIRTAIKEKGASWEPRENPISRISESQLKGLFGALEEEPHLVGPGIPKSMETLEDLPTHFDWRSAYGHNWLTDIKMQYFPRSCGSCWDFAGLGALEAHLKISSGRPDLSLDLSEQLVLSCSDGDCDGWNMSGTLSFLHETGTTDEVCFPYKARDDILCEARCPDWLTRRIRIGAWARMGDEGPYDLEDVKREIFDYGPVIAWMGVYVDFQFYGKGIYKHVWGDFIGGHYVVLVGWDETEGYWICRNSWSELWGENGYFRIRMGTDESGIESKLYILRTQEDSDHDTIPDNVDNCLTWQNTPQADNDADGWGKGCDCDDMNPDVNPEMQEIPFNRIDDDCDSKIDEFCFIATATFDP